MSGSQRRARLFRQDSAELLARADVKLGEDLVEVVLDRARADDQPRPDLEVGEAVAGETCHLGFLGGERFPGLG